jgi:hypothetical protein
MSGAIPQLPQYAFMAWCLVKAQGQLYLYSSRNIIMGNQIKENDVEEAYSMHENDEKCIQNFSRKT